MSETLRNEQLISSILKTTGDIKERFSLHHCSFREILYESLASDDNIAI